jgi:DNA-binding CsgD family transcriptional regulator
LQKALRLQNYTDNLHRQIKLCTIAIDTFTLPMLIVDGKGLIVHLNSEAMDFLDCGLNDLIIKTGYLTKSQNTNKGRLATLITDATGTPALGGAMFLSSNNALQVFITPLVAETSIDSDLQKTLALIFVIDTTKSQSLSTLNLLGKLYGFSSAELKVATALLSGKSPEEYSQQNGASINTVRSQLKALFRKTGVRGQSELLVLLSRMPPLRD